MPTTPEEQIWSIQPISSLSACVLKPGRILGLWLCVLLLLWGRYKRIRDNVFDLPELFTEKVLQFGKRKRARTGMVLETKYVELRKFW